MKFEEKIQIFHVKERNDFHFLRKFISGSGGGKHTPPPPKTDGYLRSFVATSCKNPTWQDPLL